MLAWVVAQACDPVEALCGSMRSARARRARLGHRRDSARARGAACVPRVAGVSAKVPARPAGGSGDPIIWDLMVSAVTKPPPMGWEEGLAVGRCPDFWPCPILWYADLAYMVADSLGKLQDCCRSLERIRR